MTTAEGHLVLILSEFISRVLQKAGNAAVLRSCIFLFPVCEGYVCWSTWWDE